MQNYNDQMDKFAEMYLGNPSKGISGFSNLKEDKLRGWTYEYTSKVLNDINDFESSLVDYQGNPIKSSYHPAGIRSNELKDRVKDFKDNILAGIEATHGDGYIEDHEILYVISGDTEGLKSARVDNIELFQNKIIKNNTAIGVINTGSVKFFLSRKSTTTISPALIFVNSSLSLSAVNVG